MIFLSQFQVISDDKWAVLFAHYNPFDEVNGLHKSQEDLEKDGIFVDSIPEPELEEGMIAGRMFINPFTKEITYEYMPIPQSEAEKVSDLTQRVKDLELVVAEIIGGM